MTRLRIMNVLINHKNGLYVCEIVNILDVPQYNISKHLTILKTAELVDEEKQGKMVLYKANYDRNNLSIFESIVTLVENDDLFKSDIVKIKETLSDRGKIC